MSSPEEREYVVTNRHDLVTFPKLGTPVEQRLVSYYVEPYPPRTITIPKTEWSLEEEHKRIQDDFQQWTKTKITLKVAK